MRCPSCRKEFHHQPDVSKVYSFEKEPAKDTFEGELAERNAFNFGIQLCPSCCQPIVVYQEGYTFPTATNRLIRVEFSKIVYPHSSYSELPDEVPKEYQSDYQEATTIIDHSPKASAALSRRLLQKVLREELSIKKKDLSLEIDEFIKISGAPSYLIGAIDAIRSVGNFAAHPIKNTNTGEIVEVEEGEAEWLIEVVASLFDFVFVHPQKLQQRRDALNAKLRSMGKPELKGA